MEPSSYTSVYSHGQAHGNETHLALVSVHYYAIVFHQVQNSMQKCSRLTMSHSLCSEQLGFVCMLIQILVKNLANAAFV